MRLLLGHYEYVMTAVLLLLGLWGMMGRRNLVKQLIALNIVQSAVILLFVSLSTRRGGTIPIVEHQLVGADHGGAHPIYVSPLPHVLMLTAIVVMVSTLGVAFALLIRIYRHYGTLDESRLPGGRGE